MGVKTKDGVKTLYGYEDTGMNTMNTVSVVVNGTATETNACNLAELVANTNPGDGRVATALNGKFVPVSVRATTALSSGDMIEILSARQGG